jgi:hypothetical protein
LASKKRQQTISKRNRERAIEEKRTLKRQAKQEKREAVRNGEPWPPVAPDLAPNLNAPNLNAPDVNAPDPADDEPAAPAEAPPDVG